MTKAELVKRIASSASIPDVTAAKALTAALDGITGALKRGQKVALIGFGTFSVAKRQARNGRNPRTGQSIKIPAARVPRFSPGKDLKNSIR
jgi:DNA-binding protein HU-beta